MLTVYAIAPSLYCAKLRIVLRAKRLDWTELPPTGGYGSAEYRAIVPSGNLPALIDDGFLIADSEAIAEYLEERHPYPPLLPREPQARARMRERGRFHDTRLEPALRALFPYIAPDRRDAALNAAQSAVLNERLAQLARMLEGTEDMAFGLGDCGLPVSFAWIAALEPVLGLRIDWPAPVLAYGARLLAVPPVTEELTHYRPVLSEWLASVGAGNAD